MKNYVYVDDDTVQLQIRDPFFLVYILGYLTFWFLANFVFLCKVVDFFKGSKLTAFQTNSTRIANPQYVKEKVKIALKWRIK